MYPGEKAAGNRIVGTSSSWRSSLPPPSPMIPLTTSYPAESQHFNPRPPAVTTQSLSQGFSLPMSVSSMLPAAPQTPSFSPVSDLLPMWNTSPSSPLPDTLIVQPPSPIWNLFSQDSSTTPVVDGNENAFSCGPYTSEPNSNLPDSVLATNPVGWNENAQSGPFTSVPTPSSNNPVGWNENAFINGPNHLQPPMSSVNVQDPVYSNNPVANWEVNAFSSGPSTSQQPLMSNLNVNNHASSSTNPVGWNENAFSRNLLTSEPLTSNWHLHDNVPSPSYDWNPQNVSTTNLRGWNANASSLGPSTLQPRKRQNVFSTNQRGWNANASSHGPYTSQPSLSRLSLQNPVPNTNSVSSNENASNVQFQYGPATPHGLNQIPSSSNPTETVSDPRRGKRILENGESSAQHSQEKRSRYVTVEERNRILEMEVSTLKKENEILINTINRLNNQNQTNQQQRRYGDVDNLIQQLLAETERRNQMTQETQNVGQFNHVNGSFQGR